MTVTKKKILYLALCDPDLSVTGVTVRMGAFVQQLSHFYQITLVNMTGSGHDAPPLPRGTPVDRAVEMRIQIPFSQAGYFLFSPSLYRAADRWLQTQHYDYLVADYGLAAVYGTRLAKKYRLPLIYLSSNVEYQMYWEFGRHDWRRRLLAPYVYWAERAACEAAYKVVTVSDRDRNIYAHWIDEHKIIAIPQGFDPKEMNPFYPSPSTDQKIVLFTGSLLDENNRQAARYIANELAPSIAQHIPGVTFQIVGNHPPDDLARENVDCLGFVEDIDPIIQRANVVIAPMPFGHGISTKVVMGLAYGKPVLTTPQVAGGMPRQYPQLQVASLEGFSDTLLAMLKTPAERSPANVSAKHRTSAAEAIGTKAKNFELLCQDLAWPNLIERLYQSLEQPDSCPSS